MTNKIILALLLLLSATSAFAAEVKVLYVDRQADPFYAPRQSYGAIYDVTRQSAVSGAELGVKDAQIIGRAIETTFQLNRLTIAAGDSAVARLSDRLKTERDAAVILDLPGSDIEAIALQVGGTALFNIRDRSDELRVKTCKTNLFHVVPSDAMISDALAQYLKLMRWNTILVLTGDAAQDDVQAKSIARTASKFGLNIVAQRKFVQGNDPREREQNDVKLLTGGIDYDVVFVADQKGDFSRELPYRTVNPRPVIGTAGLRATAWHADWERNGAPQLNRRFFKLAQRRMTDEDWAAWVAIRSVVEATVQASQSPGSLVEQLLKPETAFELYKGYPGSYRPWDHQLRQSILLGTSDVVVALAPVDGALHEFNTLDTLGFDAPEFHCDP